MAELDLNALLTELERLTPLVLEAIEQKKYKDFLVLQLQQKQYMDKLLTRLSAAVLTALPTAERSRLQVLLTERQQIELAIAAWAEGLKQDLMVMNQNSRVIHHYSR
ncbi:hypothetical protein HZU77_000885 [Neisseriaceae bacterium TC5R-5]|nr:hypothetical protein [Neisseriaceae bacterium TC5R-5]